MASSTYDAIVVGGGQAGLAVSYYLQKNKLNHVVLEQAKQPAYAWREQKWDSFCFVIPNWTILLPGGKYSDFDIPGDGFIVRNDIITYFEDYISRHQLPLQLDTEVISITPAGNTWIVKTNHDRYTTKHVFVATGFFRTPKMHKEAKFVSSQIQQMHSSQYKNPNQLYDGGVLVVGTGQSGMQIAEELYKSGRKVYLSVGSTGRIPRNYRGRDIIYWWAKSGLLDKPVKTLESPKDRLESNPHLSGVDNGHDLNMHQYYKDGVSLYGHVDRISPDGTTIFFKNDLKELIQKNDEFETRNLQMIDNYIKNHGIEAIKGTRNRLTDAFDQEIITEVNFETNGINNIIWATGYNRDYSMIKTSKKVVDTMGFPLQKQGVSEHAGLYFIGMPWIRNPGSGLIYSVGTDAKYLVHHMLSKHDD